MTSQSLVDEFKEKYDKLRSILEKIRSGELEDYDPRDILQLIQVLLVLSNKPEIKEKIENAEEIHESLRQLYDSFKTIIEETEKLEKLRALLEELKEEPSKEKAEEVLKLLDELKDVLTTETYNEIKKGITDYLESLKQVGELQGYLDRLRELEDKINSNLNKIKELIDKGEAVPRTLVEETLNMISEAKNLLEKFPEDPDRDEALKALSETEDSLKKILVVMDKEAELDKLLSELGSEEDPDRIVQLISEIKAKVEELKELGVEFEDLEGFLAQLEKTGEYIKAMENYGDEIDRLGKLLEKIRENIELVSQTNDINEAVRLMSQILDNVGKAKALLKVLEPVKDLVENYDELKNSLEDIEQDIRRTQQGYTKYLSLQEDLEKLSSTNDLKTIVELAEKIKKELDDPDLANVIDTDKLVYMKNILGFYENVAKALLDSEEKLKEGKVEEAYNRVKSLREVMEQAGITSDPNVSGVYEQIKRMEATLKGVLDVYKWLNKLPEEKDIDQIYKIIVNAKTIAEKTPDFPKELFEELILLEAGARNLKQLKQLLDKGDIDSALDFIKQHRETLDRLINVDETLTQLNTVKNDLTKVSEILAKIDSLAEKGDYETALTLIDRNRKLLEQYIEDLKTLERELVFNYELSRSQSLEDVLDLKDEFKDVIEKDAKAKNYFYDVERAKIVLDKAKEYLKEGKLKQAIDLLEYNADLLRRVMGEQAYTDMMRDLYAKWQTYLQAWRYTRAVFANIEELVNRVNEAINEYNRTIQSGNDNEVMEAVANTKRRISETLSVIDRLPSEIKEMEEIAKIKRYLLETRERVTKSLKLMALVKELGETLSKFMDTGNEEYYNKAEKLYLQQILPLADEIGARDVIENNPTIKKAFKIASSYRKYLYGFRKLREAISLLSSPSALDRKRGSEAFVEAWNKLMYSLKELREQGYGDRVREVVESLKPVKKQVVLGGLVDPRDLRAYEDSAGVHVDIDVPWHQQLEAWFRGGEEFYRRKVAEAWEQATRGDPLGWVKTIFYSILGGGFELGSFIPLLRDNIEGMKMLVQSIWDPKTRAMVREYLAQPENLAILISTVGMGVLLGKLVQKVVSPKIRVIVNSVIGNVDDAFIDVLKLGKTRLGAIIFYRIRNGIKEIRPKFITSKVARNVIEKALPDEIKHMDELGVKRIVSEVDGLVETFKPKIYADVKSQVRTGLTTRLNRILKPLRITKIAEATRKVFSTLDTKVKSLAKTIGTLTDRFSTKVFEFLRQRGFKPRISWSKILGELKMDELLAKARGIQLYAQKAISESMNMPVESIKFSPRMFGAVVIDALRKRLEGIGVVVPELKGVKYTIIRYKIPSGFLGEIDDLVKTLKIYGFDDLASSLVKLKESIAVKGTVDLALASELTRALDNSKKVAGLSPNIIARLKNLIVQIPDIVVKDRGLAKTLVNDIVGKLDEIAKATEEGAETTGFMVSKIVEAGKKIDIKPEEIYKMLKEWNERHQKIVDIMGEQYITNVYGVMGKNMAKRVFEFRRGKDFIRVEIEVKPVGKSFAEVTANVYVDPQTSPQTRTIILQQLLKDPLEFLKKVDPTIDKVPILTPTTLKSVFASILPSLTSISLTVSPTIDVKTLSSIKSISLELERLGALNTANTLRELLEKKISPETLADSILHDIRDKITVEPEIITKIQNTLKKIEVAAPDLAPIIEPALKKVYEEAGRDLVKTLQARVINELVDKLRERLKKLIVKPPGKPKIPGITPYITGLIPLKPKPIILIDYVDIEKLAEKLRLEPTEIEITTPIARITVPAIELKKYVIIPNIVEELEGFKIEPPNIKEGKPGFKWKNIEITPNIEPASVQPVPSTLEETLPKLMANIDTEIKAAVDQLEIQLKDLNVIPPSPPPPTPSQPKPTSKPYGGSFLPFLGFGGAPSGGRGSGRKVQRERIVI